MSGTYPDNASIQRDQGMAYDRREAERMKDERFREPRESFDTYAEQRFTCWMCGEPIEDGLCPVCDTKEN